MTLIQSFRHYTQYARRYIPEDTTTILSYITEDRRTTRRYIPKNRTLHNHRCENLKSYNITS
jgi:hypothetical protein